MSGVMVVKSASSDERHHYFVPLCCCRVSSPCALSHYCVSSSSLTKLSLWLAVLYADSPALHANVAACFEEAFACGLSENSSSEKPLLLRPPVVDGIAAAAQVDEAGTTAGSVAAAGLDEDAAQIISARVAAAAALDPEGLTEESGAACGSSRLEVVPADLNANDATAAAETESTAAEIKRELPVPMPAAATTLEGSSKDGVVVQGRVATPAVLLVDSEGSISGSSDCSAMDSDGDPE